MYLSVAVLTAMVSLPALAAGSPASAEACGRCHRGIQEAWRASAHARAIESRTFQDALEAAEAEFGAPTRRTCLTCHAPLALQAGDLELRHKVSWEGVTCGFCHQNRSVRATLVSAGAASASCPRVPSQSSSAPASNCAPCHQYRNGNGLAVLTTYSEWKSSPQGLEGKPCHSCHMYEVAGDTAGRSVNLHVIPGGHSAVQLARAIKAQLFCERELASLKVRVEVSNRGAGHYAPTGSPLRRIVLEVRAETSDGKRLRDQREYTRRIADREGREITTEPVAFMRGARVIADSRLAPGETRREEFSFPLARGTAARVRATLWYAYSALPQANAQKRFAFTTFERTVK